LKGRIAALALSCVCLLSACNSQPVPNDLCLSLCELLPGTRCALACQGTRQEVTAPPPYRPACAEHVVCPLPGSPAAADPACLPAQRPSDAKQFTWERLGEHFRGDDGLDHAWVTELLSVCEARWPNGVRLYEVEMTERTDGGDCSFGCIRRVRAARLERPGAPVCYAGDPLDIISLTGQCPPAAPPGYSCRGDADCAMGVPCLDGMCGGSQDGGVQGPDAVFPDAILPSTR
jgi:hypothetical protein